MIAGASGVVLIAALFLPWYRILGAGIAEGPVGDVIEDLGGAVGLDVSDAVSRTAWESFEITDVICLLAGALAIARAAVALLGGDDDPAVPGSTLVAAIGATALALVGYRTVNPPGVGSDRELGLWLGLVAAGGIVYGSVLAVQARRERSASPRREAGG